jgi:hypothetical protein
MEKAGLGLRFSILSAGSGKTPAPVNIRAVAGIY